MSTTRRNFLAAGAAYAITRRKGFALQTEERRVAIHPAIETGTIRPELHGHFAEHLGTCTYGGLWVGPNSSIPHINGYRKQAVEYLRALGIPVLRWPGGCFADDYHWRDGIGPAAKRPRSVNIHWGNYTEDNSFGTHEFIGLCKLIGAEPYLAGNVGSGTPQELRDWVEYCNYPSGSTLSDERIANGAREPFKVRYWGVGNENWGCGGRMTPDEYAGHYRRFATYVRPFGETRPFLIACGPNRNDTNWTRRFFDNVNLRGRFLPVHGYAMHFYSTGRSPATKFTVEHLQEQLSSFEQLEKGILQQSALIESYDPERRIGLLIDEWGVWDRIDPEEEKRFGRLWQQITMRSAVAAALGLNVFHRQAARLYMCNIAQIVNVLHSLLLTHEDKTIRTTTYHAFDLEKAHRGKASLRVDNPDASPLALSVSASKAANELIATFVNPKHDVGVRVDCAIAGASSASATGLHDGDFNACNTFEAPNRVTPKTHPVEVERGALKLTMPPMSIVTATVRLA